MSRDTPTPVALITGASSGIGLALTTHLLSKNWRVFLADVQPPPSSYLSSFPSSSYHFQHTDVSSWSSQHSSFKTSFQHFGRIDFCALNAGIDDRDDIFGSVGRELGVDMDGEKGLKAEDLDGLKKPDMKTFEVNLLGVYYGIKLAGSYMALNPEVSTSSGSNGATNGSTNGTNGANKKFRGGGKIIVTASDAGLYALAPVPQYTATKHALVGLTRSLAPSASLNNVTINAICPSLTPSNLAPPGLLENMPKETLTKMSTLIRAFDECAKFEEWWDGVAEGGLAGWVRRGRNGGVVEGRGEEIYFRDEVERVGGLAEVPKEVDEVWQETYRERNRRFARENQMRRIDK